MEAYASAINDSDTGYIERNILYSKKLTILIFLLFNKSGKYLDYAGGYGIFVRLMRDIGFDFFWDDKYTNNIFAKGFEWNGDGKVDVVTSFESFEHFVNPVFEIEKILNISKNIIFTTELLPDPVPRPEEWWYYGIEHGQHVSFYTKSSLHYLAEKYGVFYSSVGSLHLFTERRIQPGLLAISKLSRLGLHRLIQRMMKSKTWDDHKVFLNTDPH
ncbi:class I SAM-dependent methyltransferase [Marinobacterium sedimentorum]|uniref:class I SAM-dependent methyltransferase n=1 Tax=Marinobacterium sedimentorum TaxID=2927804 RepID=UPI0020C718F4|nr:class I SAM-dependent methyltransferase [Marinobacterium sedimentorum]